MATEPEAKPMFNVRYMPVNEAKMMGRAARMDPDFYSALEEEITNLIDKAAVIDIPPGMNYMRMKLRLVRVAKDLDIQLTVRKARNGIVFWKTTPEELAANEALAKRLQGGRRRAGRQRR